MIRSALVFILTVYALCITLMQVMGSVNLHESAEPSGECSERQKQIFCECQKEKKEKNKSFPTVLGHYFQTSKYPSFSVENHCNASEFQEKERLGGFTVVYVQASVGASQE